jgi:hypothetical protein
MKTKSYHHRKRNIMAQNISANPAMGKVFTFTVKRIVPRVINDNSYLTLVNGNNESVIVPKDELSSTLKPGSVVLIETRGSYTTILDIEKA